MNLWIRDTSSVPPEGWIFHVEQTGFTVRAPNYNALFDIIGQHCAANQVPPPSEQEVIAYLCAHVHVPCVEMATRTPLVNKFTLQLPVPAASCCGKVTSDQ